MARSTSSLSDLSQYHILLLAAQYAAESNIASLRSLAASRQDVLSIALLYEILSDFLPETLEPDRYVELIDIISHGQLSELDDTADVDFSSVKDLSTGKARSRVQKLGLVAYPSQSYTLVQFLIKRAHRIEEQTGLLSLIPSLVQPFLQRYPQLRTWYISCVIPLLRYEYEYYPGDDRQYSLEQVELADETAGPDLWLSRSLSDEKGSGSPKYSTSDENVLARDLRCLMGPWIYGESARKRRRLNHNRLRSTTRNSKSEVQEQDTLPQDEERNTIEDSQSAWQPTFERLIQTARTRLPLIANAIIEWDGPYDVDLGGHARADDAFPERNLLFAKYHQTALGAVYAAESSDYETISAAWRIVQKLYSETRDDINLPGLEQQLGYLPNIQTNIQNKLHGLPSLILEHSSLLHKNNPLTTSGQQSFTLAKFHVLSAGLLAQFGHPVSVIGAVKVKIHLDKDEQAALLQKITHNLASGSGRSDAEWSEIRQKLIWLWGWGSNSSESTGGDGILGKIDRKLVEKIILEILVHVGCNNLVLESYVKDARNDVLTPEEMEQVIASTALEFYDSASNGNRTRGAMKKASDIVTTFSKFYPKSAIFPRLQALIAATHAISSYSLTLQHGVPFTPVSIRVSSDPLGLIEKILAQNPGSYVKAQDLMSVGANFVAAGLTDHALDISSPTSPSPEELEAKKKRAQRRVVGMAIEAALQEDDFETAYSYVVNVEAQNTDPSDDDDIAWRAALAAGKHKSASSSSNMSASTSLNTPSALRRLEQRMDLLSQALLLAPSHALPEILSAWRKCEEEMTSLLAVESAADDAINDDAEQGIPGAYVDAAPLVQARREVGRGATEEAPMGLFDVARGAAAALSKTAFPLRGAAGSSGAPRPLRVVEESGSDAGSFAESDELAHDRVRTRDRVANVVTGGLASGIGWVLGANPTPLKE